MGTSARDDPLYVQITIEETDLLDNLYYLFFIKATHSSKGMN